jgi:hypothetical protein
MKVRTCLIVFADESEARAMQEEVPLYTLEASTPESMMAKIIESFSAALAYWPDGKQTEPNDEAEFVSRLQAVKRGAFELLSK